MLGVFHIGRAAECLSSRVVLVPELVVDLAEQVLGEGAEKVPRQIQRLEDCSVLVSTLRDKLTLELFHELDEEMVLEREGLLAHHRLHGHHISPSRIRGVQLGGDR